MKDAKVTAFCSIYSSRIILICLDPSFVGKANGNILAGETIQAMIQGYLLSQLEDMGKQNMWFQQDGATTHIQQENLTQYCRVFILAID